MRIVAVLSVIYGAGSAALRGWEVTGLRCSPWQRAVASREITTWNQANSSREWIELGLTTLPEFGVVEGNRGALAGRAGYRQLGSVQ
jgi:hypothetical protein